MSIYRYKNRISTKSESRPPDIVVVSITYGVGSIGTMCAGAAGDGEGTSEEE